MAAIGVHLGCTSACVAVYKDGRADVVANDAGDRVTPAIVAYTENEEVVGLAAKQSRIRNISNTVMKVKQILGRSSDDPQAQKYITESKCLVIEKNGKLRYEVDTGEETKFVNPEDVARLIFSKMKETAHSVLGSDANDVVITVPFDFGEKQKNALGEAARAAGFNVLRLIHEPSAALLAYGIGQDYPTGKSNILVFKLGGTSLSVSVMEVNSGIYRVLSTNTDDNIGGTHFTETLAQYLASEFQRAFKHDVRGNARAMMKLMNSADIAKHSLSTLGSANCFLDSLYEGQDFDCNVSRARFELLCSPLFNKCIEAIRGLLEQSGFTADDINKIHTESSRDIGRGRSGFHAGSLMRNSIPGLQDHGLSQRQMLHHWATQASPVSVLNQYNCTASLCLLENILVLSKIFKLLVFSFFTPRLFLLL
ncbi:heat shock 70 kDa protein 14 isoform X2 [Canis aureus]